MAQVCEAFLSAGSEVYKKEGPKFLPSSSGGCCGGACGCN